jgi:hypothetical protein
MCALKLCNLSVYFVNKVVFLCTRLNAEKNYYLVRVYTFSNTTLYFKAYKRKNIFKNHENGNFYVKNAYNCRCFIVNTLKF